MKTKKSSKYLNTKKRKLVYATGLVILVAALGIGAYALMAKPGQEAAVGPIDKKEDKSGSGTDSAKKDRDIKEEPETPVADNAATFNVTTLKQQEDKIRIVASGKNLTDGGICTAYLTSKSEQIVSKNLTVTDTGSAVECETTIPETEFNYFGEWTARITYITPDDEIIETEGKIDISN